MPDEEEEGVFTTEEEEFEYSPVFKNSGKYVPPEDVKRYAEEIKHKQMRESLGIYDNEKIKPPKTREYKQVDGEVVEVKEEKVETAKAQKDITAPRSVTAPVMIQATSPYFTPEEFAEVQAKSAEETTEADFSKLGKRYEYFKNPTKPLPPVIGKFLGDYEQADIERQEEAKARGFDMNKKTPELFRTNVKDVEGKGWMKGVETVKGAALHTEQRVLKPLGKATVRELGLTRKQLRAVPSIKPMPKSMDWQRAEQVKRKWYFGR